MDAMTRWFIDPLKTDNDDTLSGDNHWENF